MKELKKKKIRGNWSNVSMIEGWLSDMAKKGFALKEIDDTKATFEETRSEDVVYRIKYLPDNNDIKDVDMNRDEIYTQICSQGWEYICAYGYYLVFKATDNTNYNELPVYDFEIQQYLKENRKQILNYSGQMLLVVFSFSLSFFGFSTHIKMDFIISNGGFALFCLWLLTLLKIMVSYIFLFNIRRKIRTGNKKRINRRKLRFFILTYACLAVVLYSFGLYGFFGPKQEYSPNDAPEKVISLSDIEDIKDNLIFKDYSSAEVSSSFLAPDQYYIYETYTNYGSQLKVNYYELRYKFLANSLVRDLKKYWYNDVYEIESDYFDLVETSKTYHDSLYIVIISDDIVLSIEYSGDKTAEEILYTVEKKLKQPVQYIHKENHSFRCGSLRLFG